MIIINGETDEHLEMLEGGVMRQLLDEKWKTFARVYTKLYDWKGKLLYLDLNMHLIVDASRIVDQNCLYFLFM